MILRHYKPSRHDPRKNAGYLSWIRSLPCAVCWVWRIRPGRDSKVEAAHVGVRGLSRKCSDLEAIPFCIWHHRTGPQSHHQLGKGFWQFWKLNRIEVIREYQARYEKEKAA
jgi:hypothetical protein